MGEYFCGIKHIHNGVLHLQIKHWVENPQQTYSAYISPALGPKIMTLKTSACLTSKPQRS